ncbi:MAG: Nif3-like dinuclear metal center hexameric protein [Desulfobulbus propionicus]|nr:MAG: Nif3-like dinuclear metal center hexameric protein [Desulfobulbus propionicus]
MSVKVQDLLTILQDIAPASLAESWDNVGLLVGDRTAVVTGILLGLDPCSLILEEAVAAGCNLVITHHPVIFRPLKAVQTDSFPGNIISHALQHRIALIGCHTNLDAVAGGVSDILAEALSLQAVRALIPGDTNNTAAVPCGLGRIGTCNPPITPGELINRLCRKLSPPWLLEAGPRPREVSTVSVCGGSCGDFAETAWEQGADIFITSEIKHSVARWAEEVGLWIIDGGHFATEQPAVPALQIRLQHALDRMRISIPVHISTQMPPLTIITESILSPTTA